MTSPRRLPLDHGERGALQRAVGKMRALLTRELTQVLEGTFGIRAGRPEPEDESRLSLPPDQLLVRRELVGLWEAMGRQAELVVRHAAFTHTNRLVAVRVAEAIGLLPESLGRGRRSSGYRQLLEVAPLLGSDDDAGYWTYLQLCGDELAHDVPNLFDPRNPLLALRPPPGAVDELVDLVTPDDLGVTSPDGSAWAAPDTLGWTYQFFNSDEERSKMRRESPQPLDSRELAVRNQFFTPDYVVGFLVHNSLGRRLVEGGVTQLVADLDYLVDPPAPSGEPVDLAAIKVLDPACGSGHFLLGAYDVLETAWSCRGVPAAKAAPAIVRSLWGIDIDARAAQVAAAAIMFRARRHDPDSDLPAPNVVCARSVPDQPGARDEMLAAVPRQQQTFLTELMAQLDRAPELGSLLKVDAFLAGDTALRMTFGGGATPGSSRRSKAPASVAGTLIEWGIEIGELDVEAVVDQALHEVQAVADEVTSTPSERVLAAEGGDALRLVTALTQRYDAVLMNPPFGEPIPDTKPYLKKAYPWIPGKDYNLFAAFVGRGLELCTENGYVGAITSRAGMFLTTFERWRKEVLLANDLVALADLGHRVMHEALVEAAAYVIRKGRSIEHRPATFIRLLRETSLNRPTELKQVCERLREGSKDQRVFQVVAHDFEAIPGAPMAYWVNPDIRRLFTVNPPLEGRGAEVRQGLATGDDFRFVRAFWEVDPHRIARKRDDTFDGKRWTPFAKGGEYSPFWADIYLVVDYRNDGEELRSFAGSVIRNPQYYFRPGLTWPERTTSGFGVRVMPAACVFSHVGHGAFPLVDPLDVLAYLTSRVAQATVLLFMGSAEETMSGSPAKRYAVGVVQRLPWPDIKLTDDQRHLLLDLIANRVSADLADETTRRFVRPILPETEGLKHTVRRTYIGGLWRAVDDLARSNKLDRAVADASSLTEAANDYVDAELGPHPVEYPQTEVTPPELERLFLQPLDTTIDQLIEQSGGGRAIANLTFTANRRLEVLAHGLRVHPQSIVQAAEQGQWLPNGTLESAAAALFSYLVGCAFGRWDIRVGRDPELAPKLPDDPFAPVPLCPPGMLVGPDGFPTTDVPPGYPLALTPHRILVDEPGHPADIGAAVEAAAEVLVDDASALLDELASLLGASDPRTYLRKRFFKDHLARYSKSRRKAPLYWPLTVPSRDWTVWVSAPTLTREAIYAVRSHAERRLTTVDADIRRMESAQIQASAPGTSGYDPATVRSLTGRLDVQRRLSEELRQFGKAVTVVAESGWQPDLDDGIVLCAAPFADVFPDWSKDLVATRRQIRSGRFGWAKVDRYRELL